MIARKSADEEYSELPEQDCSDLMTMRFMKVREDSGGKILKKAN